MRAVATIARSKNEAKIDHAVRPDPADPSPEGVLVLR